MTEGLERGIRNGVCSAGGGGGKGAQRNEIGSLGESQRKGGKKRGVCGGGGGGM